MAPGTPDTKRSAEVINAISAAVADALIAVVERDLEQQAKEAERSW
jgi:hypothetical protein